MSILRALRVARAVLAAAVAPWAFLGAQSPPPAAPAGAGTLGGVVYDSLLTDAAVPDVEVWLDGTTLTARTNRAGRFRFDSVPPGRHRVAFLHPALDAQRIGAPAVTVDVTAGAHAEVRLVTPAAAAVHGALCPAGEARTGLLLGLVTSPGAPGAAADVVASWVVWTLARGGMRAEPREVAVRTGDDGAFRLCGVPTDVPVQLRTQRTDGAVAVSEVAFGGRAVALALVPLPATREAVGDAVDAVDVAPSPTLAALRGTVRTATGFPVSGAEVRLVDAGPAIAAAVTRDDGSFALRELPPGTHQLEARAIGFRPVRLRLALTAGRVTPVALALGDDATVLATTHVTARRASAMAQGYERRLVSGAGHFVTRAELEKWRPTSTLEAVAMVPGVRLVPNGTGSQFGATQISIPRALTGPLTNATCRAAIYVDGVRWIADAGQSLETMVRPSELYGIEVHTSVATIPLEYLAPDAGCGVVLLWTRRSRER